MIRGCSIYARFEHDETRSTTRLRPSRGPSPRGSAHGRLRTVLGVVCGGHPGALDLRLRCGRSPGSRAGGSAGYPGRVRRDNRRESGGPRPARAGAARGDCQRGVAARRHQWGGTRSRAVRNRARARDRGRRGGHGVSTGAGSAAARARTHPLRAHGGCRPADQRQRGRPGRRGPCRRGAHRRRGGGDDVSGGGTRDRGGRNRHGLGRQACAGSGDADRRRRRRLQ